MTREKLVDIMISGGRSSLLTMGRAMSAGFTHAVLTILEDQVLGHASCVPMATHDIFVIILGAMLKTFLKQWFSARGYCALLKPFGNGWDIFGCQTWGCCLYLSHGGQRRR